MGKPTHLFAATALSLAAFVAEAASDTSDPIPVEVTRRGGLMREAERFESPADAAAHRADFAKFRQECTRGAFVIGQASSMENVRPRAGFRWHPADEVRVRLARGERESVQILVAPNGRGLRGVKVAVEGDMASVEGQKSKVEGRESTSLSTIQPFNLSTTLAATNVVACVVGYVLSTNVPPYNVRPTGKPPARGWWPDPILDFQKSCDICGDDVQSFWVRVTCPRDQASGAYAGALVVSADGEAPVRIPFAVRVNDFEIGEESPLPLAITCIGASGRKDIREKLEKEPENYWKAWKTREEKYCDFFADYYITWQTIYGSKESWGEPRWEMLARLKEQGRLGMFCLCYFSPVGEGAEAAERWRAMMSRAIAPRYEKAKALGILDKAYFYGCDELEGPLFPRIEAAAKILHEEFPGVPVMTTARDKQLGTGDSPLKSIDIQCPALCFWDRRPLAEAQKAGTGVWWYFCNTPSWPYANATLEDPPAELRSFMGAQTRKFKADGFLYYCTTKWNGGRPIDKGPYTDWDACSLANYHGDGQWTCCGGPDRLPLPTIRLENFRDGLEDLWYVRRLEEALREVEGDVATTPSSSQSGHFVEMPLPESGRDAPTARPRDGESPSPRQDWLDRARAELAVPDEVAKTISDFSTDPAVIYRWRDEMADLIEEANGCME